MATRTYVGAAVRTAQVTTIQITGYDAATTYKVTMNGKVISTIAAGSANATATALETAWNASTEAEISQVTASSSTDTLSLTADTPGIPLPLQSSLTRGAGTIGAATASTANSGPEDYSLAANWSGGTAPVNGDTVIIEGNFDLMYGTLASVTAAELIIRDFSGTMGLPPINASGNYPEYRSQYFLMSATIINIMDNVTSGLIRLNVGSAQTTATVYTTGSPSVSTIKAVTFLGTHASNVLNVLSGSVGVATESGEAATLATWRTGAGTFGGTLDLELGLGCTLTEGLQGGGIVRLAANCATVTSDGGSIYLIDDPDVSGTLTINAGSTAIVNGGPTIAKLLLQGGTVDALQDIRPFTVSACSIGIGSTVNDRYGRAVLSAGYVMIGGASLTNTQLDFGPNRTFTVT